MIKSNIGIADQLKDLFDYKLHTLSRVVDEDARRVNKNRSNSSYIEDISNTHTLPRLPSIPKKDQRAAPYYVSKAFNTRSTNKRQGRGSNSNNSSSLQESHTLNPTDIYNQFGYSIDESALEDGVVVDSRLNIFRATDTSSSHELDDCSRRATLDELSVPQS